MKNLFDNLPVSHDHEHVDVLVDRGPVRIERIVSHGQCSPDGFWYDQDEHEWVTVLSGQGILRFEDQDEAVPLKAGDQLEIVAHRRHRVEWTTPDEPTIWLAVFYGQQVKHTRSEV